MFGFSIREIFPHVYHLHFEYQYDLAMHFLRFQEYYESPKFHGKIFSLTEYMEWYAREHGEGAFTYPKDWSGFNVPSWVLHQVRNSQDEIPDINGYDRFMFQLIDWIRVREHPKNYYFIGTSSSGFRGDESEENVVDHEIAHALYFVDSDYHTSVNELIYRWANDAAHKGEELGKAREILSGMGYRESVLNDEVHAYCATGLCEKLEGVISESEVNPFQQLFQEYKTKCMPVK